MNALNDKNFLLYFITNTLSLLGTWIQKIGVGWLTWEITHSTFWTSFVTLSLMAPAGIFGPLFAVFAERWDMRKASLYLKILMLLVGIGIWYMEYLQYHTLLSLAFFIYSSGINPGMLPSSSISFYIRSGSSRMLSSAVGLNVSFF